MDTKKIKDFSDTIAPSSKSAPIKERASFVLEPETQNDTPGLKPLFIILPINGLTKNALLFC
jgi:hypothetical protein